MSEENGRSAFSVRIPTALKEQIEARAKLSRRTINAEIQLLLEQAIDLHVARDLKLQHEMRKVKEAETTMTS